MVGYNKFLDLTLQRWKRFVIVQNLCPLLPKESLIGSVERVRSIHNPENGCYMRKALVLMKSEVAAAYIVREKHHSVGKDGHFTTVESVEYKGRVRQYRRGRFKLFLMLPLPPLSQDTADERSKIGYHLTRELVKAYQGYLFTSIRLDTECVKDHYTGIATVRFEFETDKDKILERTKQKLDVEALWVDTEDESYNAGECFTTVMGFKPATYKAQEVEALAVEEKVEEDHVSESEDVQDHAAGQIFGEHASDDTVEEGLGPSDWNWNVEDHEWLNGDH